MDDASSTKKCDTAETKQFASAHALRAWLTAHGIDVQAWGQNKSKTVQHLWHELRQGDACIQVDPPLRRVDVAQIIIRRQERVLVETIQEFGDGQRRHRNQPPSEKMQPDESYLQAAHRCLREELGVSPETAVFHKASYEKRNIDSDSPSYPGLPTRYTFHRMEADVPALSDDDFWWENVSSHEGDPVQRHFWSWQKIEGALGWPELISPA